jgi:hypothetical protein
MCRQVNVLSVVWSYWRGLFFECSSKTTLRSCLIVTFYQTATHILCAVFRRYPPFYSVAGSTDNGKCCNPTWAIRRIEPDSNSMWPDLYLLYSVHILNFLNKRPNFTESVCLVPSVNRLDIKSNETCSTVLCTSNKQMFLPYSDVKDLWHLYCPPCNTM